TEARVGGNVPKADGGARVIATAKRQHEQNKEERGHEAGSSPHQETRINRDFRVVIPWANLAGFSAPIPLTARIRFFVPSRSTPSDQTTPSCAAGLQRILVRSIERVGLEALRLADGL